MSSDTRTLRIAAVQTPAATDLHSGLATATPLLERAAAEGAELIVLPELMATNYVFTTAMWSTGEPSRGPTVGWLTESARRLGVWIGTSFLEAEGDDFYNTFVLVGPTGVEAGRVRKQTPAMYEPWFFRGESGSHVIRTAIGNVGVGICNDNHRSYLPRMLQEGGADIVLMPHCWPLPTTPHGAISAADIERWRAIQAGMAPLYARLLGVPALFVNKVGAYSSPGPARWLPGSGAMRFPGHAVIADSDGTVVGELDAAEGVLVATVHLDPARKVVTRPATHGAYVYPAGIAGVLARFPAWLFSGAYVASRERRRRAREISATS